MHIHFLTGAIVNAFESRESPAFRQTALPLAQKGFTAFEPRWLQSPAEGMEHMADLQQSMKKHTLHIDAREHMTATGIRRVDFFSDELITAQTDMGQLNIKGQALHIDSLNADTGDMRVVGKVAAVSYTESSPALSFFGRLFK